MKTLWTFGDSFTYGFGVKFDEKHINDVRTGNETGEKWTDILRVFGNNPDKIWPVLLSKKLNMELKNFGICAISNDMIFDILIDNFNDIQEGDVVVVGATDPRRIGIVNNVMENLSSLTAKNRISDEFSKIYNKTSARYNTIVSHNRKPLNKENYHRLIKNRRLNPLLRKHRMKFYFEDVGFESPQSLFELIDYRLKMSDILEKEAITNFKFVMDRLEEKGVKTLLFNKDMWWNFERFMEDENQIDDWHWTIKGNSDFCDVVFDSLNKNKKLLLSDFKNYSFSDDSDPFIY